MVLGLYYMTKSHGGMFGSGMRFSSMSEARQAYDQDVVHLHAKVMVRLDDGTKMETTMGRILFNEVVPKGVGFINEVLTKRI